MKDYELTIYAGNQIPVSLRINNKRNIFFGTKSFSLKPSTNIEFCEVLNNVKFDILSNNSTKHPSKFEMPTTNLKLYVDTELTQSEYEYSNYFLLKELGGKSVMLKNYLTPDSIIEKLGKNKIRIYISENLIEGNLNFSSPAYFVANREFAQYTQYRGIQIAYNTEQHKRSVRQTAFFEKSYQIKSHYMDGDAIILVTNENIPTNNKNINVYVQNSNLMPLNGMQNLEVISSNLLKVQNKDIVDFYAKINTTIHGKFYFTGGTKIYCDCHNIKIGDTIVFDYKTSQGESFSITNISKDEQGFYLLIDEFIEKKPKYVCKSHTHIKDTDIVNFSYENKTAYYVVSDTDVTKELLWLTHKPDTVRGGRANHTLSYIDCYFEYEELEYIMRNSYENSYD